MGSGRGSRSTGTNLPSQQKSRAKQRRHNLSRTPYIEFYYPSTHAKNKSEQHRNSVKNPYSMSAAKRKRLREENHKQIMDRTPCLEYFYSGKHIYLNTSWRMRHYAWELHY